MKRIATQREPIIITQRGRAVAIQYATEKIILFGSLATGNVHLVHPKVATDFFIYTPEELEHGQKENRSFFADDALTKGQVLYDKNA